MLLKRWDEGRLLWEAKGLGVESITELLASKPEFAHHKLSQTTIQRRSHTAQPIPADIAAFIEGLETPRTRRHQTEIVEAGLQVLAGEPVTPRRDPRELALALLAHFPTDEFALKLADALSKLAGLSSGTGSLFDVFAQAIAGRLPRMPKIRAAKLARLLARHLTHQLDRLSLKRLALSGAAGGVGGSLVACTLLGLASVGMLFLVMSGRVRVVAHPDAPHAAQMASVTQQPPPVVVVTSGATGTLLDLRAYLGAVAEMGKNHDNWMPKEPLPFQKLAKDCKPSLGELAINGGCWVWITYVQPPCGDLFRNGDKCYRPVAADPTKPVGVSPTPPGQ